MVEFDLLPGQFKPGSTIAYAGLAVKIEKGWHVYWKNPGEGGLPPKFELVSSKNLGSLDVVWPSPKAFNVGGFFSLGYDEDVVLPLKLAVIDPAKPVFLTMDVVLYGCSTECVPFQERLSVVVSPGDDAKADSALAYWLANVPVRAKEDNFRGEFTPATGNLRIPKLLQGYDQTSNPIVDAGVSYAVEPVLGVVSGSDYQFTVRALGQGTSLNNFPSQVHLLSMRDGRWLSSDINVHIVEPLSLSVILFAFLGGLLLNVMPCVLPILAIKLVGFTKDVPERRTAFFWSGVGMVCSFLVLAGFTVLLRAVGQFAGWGIQFQSPYFLIFMATLTFVFSFSFMEQFTFRLPYGLNDLLYKISHGNSVLMSFTQGLLATLLATPCSAPFVGTSVGFALTAGTGNIVAIFLSMGLGMASPYFMIAALPSSKRYVPTSTRRLSSFKTALAFGLLMTSAMLLVFFSGFNWWIFIAVTVAFCLLLLILIRPLKLAIWATVFFCLSVFSFYYLQTGKASFEGYVSFDRAKISEHLAAGKIVVVEITADWCLTCKINERDTFSNTEVLDRLKMKDIVVMRGDWTRPDPAIEGFLKDHRRFGIPFTVVYDSRFKNGNVLPELLTPAILLKALHSA